MGVGRGRMVDFWGEVGGGGPLFKGGLDGWIVMRNDEALSRFPYWEVPCEGYSKIGDLFRDKGCFRRLGFGVVNRV